MYATELGRRTARFYLDGIQDRFKTFLLTYRFSYLRTQLLLGSGRNIYQISETVGRKGGEGGAPLRS